MIGAWADHLRITNRRWSGASADEVVRHFLLLLAAGEMRACRVCGRLHRRGGRETCGRCTALNPSSQARVAPCGAQIIPNAWPLWADEDGNLYRRPVQCVEGCSYERYSRCLDAAARGNWPGWRFVGQGRVIGARLMKSQERGLKWKAA